jgi:hypothetical protein
VAHSRVHTLTSVLSLYAFLWFLSLATVPFSLPCLANHNLTSFCDTPKHTHARYWSDSETSMPLKCNYEAACPGNALGCSVMP